MKQLIIDEKGLVTLREVTDVSIAQPDAFLEQLGFRPPAPSGTTLKLNTVRLNPLEIVAESFNRFFYACSRLVFHLTSNIDVVNDTVTLRLEQRTPSGNRPAALLPWSPPEGFKAWVGVELHDGDVAHIAVALIHPEKGSFLPPLPNTHDDGSQCTGSLRLSGDRANPLERAREAIHCWERNLCNRDLALGPGAEHFLRWKMLPDGSFAHTPNQTDYAQAFRKTANALLGALLTPGGGLYAQ